MTRSQWTGAVCGIATVRVFLLLLPAALPAVENPDITRGITKLADPDWQVRASAATALGKMGADKAAIGALTSALEDDNSRVRRAAATALGAIGQKASRSIPNLVALFDDIDAGVIAAAVASVGRMGSRASRSVPDVTALLDHQDERVQVAAAEALGRIGRRARDSAAAGISSWPARLSLSRRTVRIL